MQEQRCAKDLAKRIRTELTIVWSCLVYYEQWFGSKHAEERTLLEQQLPGFAALQQRLLLDQAVNGLSRLMDTATQRSNENLGFDRLIHHSAHTFPEHLTRSFEELNSKWRTGHYRAVKDYRDHYLGHNDWPTKQHDDADIFFHPDRDLTNGLRAAFCDAWGLFGSIHFALHQRALVEPQFASIEMHPAQMVRVVAAGRQYFAAITREDHTELAQNCIDGIEPVHSLCKEE